MLNSFFQSVLADNTISVSFQIRDYLLCTAVSMILGLVIAAGFMYKNTYHKGFVVTLAMMPVIVQMIIMLVNGNLGTGVAVMGAFSLIRFRSAPGTAREICSIFLAMAVGLATGMGYLGIAVLFVLIIEMFGAALARCRFGEEKTQEMALRITIPESLDYTAVLDEILDQYLCSWELVQVKTTNMGSLFRLEYRIVMKDPTKEKQFIDDLRCRNGNLEIMCSRAAIRGEEQLS